MAAELLAERGRLFPLRLRQHARPMPIKDRDKNHADDAAKNDSLSKPLPDPDRQRIKIR